MINLIITILLVFALHFPLGYLLCKRFIPKGNFLLSFPIYVGIGMAMASCFLTAIFFFNIFVLIIFYTVPWIILIKLYYKDLNKLNRKRIIETLKKIKTLDYLLPLTAFSLIFFIAIKGLITSNASGVFLGGLGDLQHAGAYISAMLKYQVTYLNYPTGGYIIPASISLLTGIIPGETLHICTTIIFALMPCILFSITYFITKSNFFAFLMYLMSFYIAGAYLNLLLYGLTLGGTPITGNYYFEYFFFDFYNGSYARVWGMFSSLIFFVITMCILKYHLNEKQESDLTLLQELRAYPRDKYLIMESICLGLVLGSSIFTYASVTPILSFFLGLNVLLFFMLKKNKIVITLITAFIITILISGFYMYSYFQVGPPINMPTFSLPIIITIGIIGCFVSLGILYVRYKNYELSRIQKNSLYIAFLFLAPANALFLLITNGARTLDFLAFWTMTPWQLIPIHGRIISIQIISAFLFNILIIFLIAKFIIQKKPKIYETLQKKIQKIIIIPKKIRTNTELVFILIIFAFFSPILGFHLIRTPQPFVSANDIKALQWIDKNIPTSDCLANDPYEIGHYSAYILSFSMKNITFFKYVEMRTIFPNELILKQNPSVDSGTTQLFDTEIPNQNYTNAVNILQIYNITWVFISDKRSAEYVAKWDAFANSNVDIKIAFLSGNARVLSIITNN